MNVPGTPGSYPVGRNTDVDGATPAESRPNVLHVPAGDGIALWVPEEPPSNPADAAGQHSSTYTFMATVDSAGAALAVVDTVVPPGNGQAEHVHEDTDESFYVLDGEFLVCAGDESFVIKPGDYALVPRGMSHHWKNVSTGTSRMIRMYTPVGHERYFFEINRTAAREMP